MGLNITQMRASLYNICGIDVDDASNTVVDEQLNKSWWEIMDKFEFNEKETVIGFSLVANKGIYNVPDPFEALTSIAVLDANDKYFKLDRVTPEWYEANHDNSIDANDFPLYYFREATEITLEPTPDQAYTAVMRYMVTLADLSGSNSRVSIPQSWHEIILYGGCWRMMIELGDLMRASAIKKHQVALIDSAVPTKSKEAVDSRLANLEVVVPPYRL